MKSKDNQRQTPAVVEDEAAEGLKKRAQDLGLIVNAGAGHERGTVASQTKTTVNLDQDVKRAADEQMAGGKKGGEK